MSIQYKCSSYFSQGGQRVAPVIVINVEQLRNYGTDGTLSGIALVDKIVRLAYCLRPVRHVPHGPNDVSHVNGIHMEVRPPE